MNFPHSDNPDRSEIKSLTSLISSCNLEFSINESTHNGGHILDNVIIRNDTKFAYSFSIRDLGLLDHYMIEVLLDLSKPSDTKKS